MDVTDSQLLPYPQQNDPADDALDLQVLAEAIDAKLVAQFANFRSILNAEVFISTLSADETGFTSTPTEVTFDTTLYNSTADPNNSFFPEGPFFATTGYYRVGTYIKSAPAGVVNANTSRFVYLEYRQQLALPPGTVNLDQWVSLSWEPNTGNQENQIAEGLVRVDNVASPGSFLHAMFASGNTSSTTTVFAGSTLWFYKVSELEDF